MKNINRPSRKKAIFQVIILLLVIPAMFAAMNIIPAAAQLSNEAWTQPVNLSRSGAASNPIMVVDSAGVYHVIWQDTFSGYVYTHGDGEQWTTPIPVNFPWSKPAALRLNEQTPTPELIPHLFADANGFVHALWMNEENVLYYSRVNAKQFGSPGAWLSRQRLAENALALDASLDASGHLHLAYIRAKESNEVRAGVYYHRLISKSNNWSLPVLLYESPYFRTLTSETAHVQVDTASTAEGERVYVVWDNPTRDRVYFTRSADTGKTWDVPVEVDRPAEGTAIGGPSKILISASGNNVFLFWSAEQSGTSCSHFYQTSQDGGTTWQERHRKPESFLDCPTRSDLMEIDETNILLSSVINDQVYLQAWDGGKWSDPQAQTILTNFTDPETNRLVNLSCQQPVMLPGGNLPVVGCDTGSGQDIWWLKRQLVDVADWFSKEAVWNPVANITTGNVVFQSPVLISENNNRVHALWSQPFEAVPDGPGTEIYYARWEGRQWSQAVAVYTSPTGKAESPAGAIDATGQLFVVWSGGLSGEIYFSQVNSNQGVLVTSWSKPQQLQASPASGSHPDILVDPSGRIYVVYAVPLNEGRGIYLTYSDDQGETWAEAERIFDAVATGWEMVDNPRLVLTGNGSLHLIFTRYSLPTGIGPLGLYYAQSNGDSQSWSPAVPVVEKPVVWSEMIGFGQETIHRLWQELSSGRTTLWHEASMNNGETWTRTAPVSIFGDTVGTPAVAWDPAGQLQLMQIVSRGGTNFVLQHWLWNGTTWSTERNLDLDLAAGTEIRSLVNSASPDGHLAVLFSGRSISRETGLAQNTLYFADRSYQLPEVLPTPQPMPTPTPELAATQTAEALIEPTAIPTGEVPTTEATLPGLSEEPANTGNAWVGSVLVPVAAGLIVLVAILIGVRMRQP